MQSSAEEYTRPELMGKITSSLAEALNDDENPFAGKGVETTHTTSDHASFGHDDSSETQYASAAGTTNYYSRYIVKA